MRKTAVHYSNYVAGWNDTEYGINHWTDSPKWKNPLEWALHCKKICEDDMPKRRHNAAYYKGVIECVTQYQNAGKVERLVL